jgi:peptidoglycan-N-acetylglucosamine deacetylase
MRNPVLRIGVCVLTGTLLLLLKPINAATSDRMPSYQTDVSASNEVSSSVPKIVPPVLPYALPTVTNADKTLPLPAMMATSTELSQVRSYVPASLAASANFAKAYQIATQTDAKSDYESEKTDHITQIVKGDPNVKKIALTFDDGPHGARTLQLVSELKSLNVPATFFVVGKQAVKFPQLVQLEVVDGNEVGNHTYDHVNLTRIPAALVPYELDECDAVLRHIIGTSPRFFRPPGGDIDPAVVRAAAAHGYITTLWSEDPGDYERPPSELILQRCMFKLKPGVIFLLHDGIPQTMQMLPEFVAAARKQGYTFVTMSQLASDGKVLQQY